MTDKPEPIIDMQAAPEAVQVFPTRGPALIYISDGDPPGSRPTITRLDTVDDGNFAWLSRRDLAFIDVLIEEYRARLSIYREDGLK